MRIVRLIRGLGASGYVQSCQDTRQACDHDIVAVSCRSGLQETVVAELSGMDRQGRRPQGKW